LRGERDKSERERESSTFIDFVDSHLPRAFFDKR
jgi:hypothetical protein